MRSQRHIIFSRNVLLIVYNGSLFAFDAINHSEYPFFCMSCPFYIKNIFVRRAFELFYAAPFSNGKGNKFSLLLTYNTRFSQLNIFHHCIGLLMVYRNQWAHSLLSSVVARCVVKRPSFYKRIKTNVAWMNESYTAYGELLSVIWSCLRMPFGFSQHIHIITVYFTCKISAVFKPTAEHHIFRIIRNVLR